MCVDSGGGGALEDSLRVTSGGLKQCQARLVHIPVGRAANTRQCLGEPTLPQDDALFRNDSCLLMDRVFLLLYFLV